MAANYFGIAIKIYAWLVSAFWRYGIYKTSVNLWSQVSDNPPNHTQTMKLLKLAYFWKASFKLTDVKHNKLSVDDHCFEAASVFKDRYNLLGQDT